MSSSSIASIHEHFADPDRSAHAEGHLFFGQMKVRRQTSEVRYYILSKYLSGKRFAEAVRGHWSIENSLHWQLDVTFGEDQSRIRKGHADVNFSLLRRTSLSLLKNNKTAKVGVKNKRLKAGRNDAYLLEVLFGT